MWGLEESLTKVSRIPSIISTGNISKNHLPSQAPENEHMLNTVVFLESLY